MIRNQNAIHKVSDGGNDYNNEDGANQAGDVKWWRWLLFCGKRKTDSSPNIVYLWFVVHDLKIHGNSKLYDFI